VSTQDRSAAGPVREALARLREAGAELRARPASVVHAMLADVLDDWSAADSPWQKMLVERLPACTGFARETLREGLARGLAPYTGAALHALVRSELGGPEALDAPGGRRVAGFPVTATVLAGAIPMPGVLSIVAPLALRSAVLVKPSAHDPVTAPLLARALADRDPALGAAVAVVDFRRDDAGALDALCSADCVVATGSDAAVSAIAARVAPPRRFLAHGHRFSVALLGDEAARGEPVSRAADGLALDVALWDQLGCLSPVSVHVVSENLRAADRVAEALSAALARTEARLPRGRVEPEAAAAIASARAEAEMRGAAGRPVVVLAPASTAWTVVREDAAALRGSPLHRFVRVHPAPDLESVLAALRPHRSHLAAAALAGFGPDAPEVAAALEELGVSRVCAPGELQSPPLAWRRDGRGVLVPLAG
jgi:hypothetical protein